MKRRALIIYCDNTDSGKLVGPPYDNKYYREFLQSKLGGDWTDKEILSMRNPNSAWVLRGVTEFLNGADYTFTIFTGHGFLNEDDNNRQYIELENKSIAISNLRTTARRQTLIIDACRGYYSPYRELIKSFSEQYDHFIGDPHSTRQMFDNAVLRAEEGWTILYAASENQTALDTGNGAAYLLSLLKIAEHWEKFNKRNNVLTLKGAHNFAKNYVFDNFDTIQEARMNKEKRLKHFPFAVKASLLHG